MSDHRSPCALTIAGSDSGGGAGIQADLKTFAAHGVHGLSAITVLTAQHTRGLTALHVPPVAFLRAQIDACFDDFRIGAVKIGMLGTAEVVHAVADALEHFRPPAIVLDPVMVATSGDMLVEVGALDAMHARLLPLATMLTPNIPEAEAILGHAITTSNAADEALMQLRQSGAHAVLLKGGHLVEGAEVIDRYDDGVSTKKFMHKRLALQAHGTGCTFASSVVANLCLGYPLSVACGMASDYVSTALAAGYRAGRGENVMLCHRPHDTNHGPENKKTSE